MPYVVFTTVGFEAGFSRFCTLVLTGILVSELLRVGAGFPHVFAPLHSLTSLVLVFIAVVSLPTY